VNTDSTQVQVDSIPSAAIVSAGPFCQNGGNQTLQARHNAGGRFFGASYIDSAGIFNPWLAGVGQHKLYYRFRDSRGCVNTDSMQVQVDSIPSAAIVSAGPFCQNGGNQTLQARHNAGGRFFGASYIDSAGIFNPWLAQIGNNKIYYRFRDSRGCVNTDSIQVQVDSIPSAAIVSAGPFCQNGGNQTLQARHNAGGRFFGASYIDSAGVFNPWLAQIGNNKVYYRFRDSRGCVNTDSMQVQVDSIPSSAIVSAGPFCQNGGNQTLQARHNAGGRFFGASYIDSAGTFNPWLAQIGNNKVYYRFRDSRGCVNTDSTQVQVDTIPSAAIVSAGPFCQNGGNQTLQARHNAGGRFFGASYIDSAGVFNPWLAQIGNNKVYYRFRDSRGCVNTDSTGVQVDSIPSAAIVSAGPFCQNGGNQTLQARHNSGGRFFGGSFVDSAGTFNPWLAQIGNNKVYYRFRDSRGCVNTDSMQVQVDSIPSSAIVSAGPFCQNGGNQTLQARHNAGGRFFGASYIDSAGIFNPWLAQIGNNKIYYRFRDSRGCVNTDSIQVQVDSIPSAAIVSAGPFCQNGGNQTLQARHNAGGLFGGGSYTSPDGVFDPSKAALGLRTVTYSFTDARGCTGTDSIGVQVILVPDARISPITPLCGNASPINLRPVEAGGVFSGGTYIRADGFLNPALALPGKNMVYYRLTNGLNCSNTDSLEIEILAVPEFDWRIDPGRGCEPLRMGLNTRAYDSLSWTMNDTLVSGQPVWNPLMWRGNHRLKLQVFNANGCKQERDTLLRVHPKPAADFSFAPGKVYMSNPSVQFTDNSSGAIQDWAWDFGDGSTAASRNPFKTYNKSDTFTIRLIVRTAENCSDTAFGILEVNDDFMVYIPDAFTPNGDGVNEVFKVTGEGIDHIHCQIYTRWGEKVFDDVRFSSWDGKYKGVNVPSGVYVYTMTLTDLKGYRYYRSGNITLLR
jgi:large repetitive protein